MRTGFLLLAIGGVGVWGAPSALAVSCVKNTGLISAERATQFLEKPEALLDKYKNGQGALASEVRDLLTTRPETVEGVLTLVKASSSDDQSRAIGAGLGTAASVCVLTQPAIAQHIQEVVLKTENTSLIQAFVSITGEISTQAVTGADPNGDATAGGGSGTSATGRPGSVSAPFGLPGFGGAGGGTSTAPAALFAAGAAAGATPFSPVSPSR
jgi:hypothetical protein